jgi:hypothetical protein
MKLLCLCVVLAILASCESSNSTKSGSRSSGDKMTYSQAVSELRRPPTASTSTPEGDLIATWETEVPEGTRQLIMTFDRSRELKASEVRTVPRRR